VIAYGRGGSLETVREGDAGTATGMFFGAQTAAAIAAAVRAFDQASPTFRAAQCRANAERFSAERFRAQFEAFVNNVTAGRRRALPESAP
jgi:glycosyltransferase involved in cell wall biosynthesis